MKKKLARAALIALLSLLALGAGGFARAAAAQAALQGVRRIVVANKRGHTAFMESFRQFLSFVLFCGGSDPIAQIRWLSRSRFDALVAEGRECSWPERDEALSAIAAAFALTGEDPYETVKALQAEFDPAGLRFSEEYYDVLGLEPPLPAQ